MHTRPVFADPSGRRRRALRRIGFVSATALAICLGAVVVAMAGGPRAPFTQWAAPRAPAAATHRDGAVPGYTPDRSVGSPSPPGPQPGSTLSPSPKPTSAPSPTPTPQPATSGTAASSVSPVPTNPAGRTPPGHTKSPHPGNGSHGP